MKGFWGEGTYITEVPHTICVTNDGTGVPAAAFAGHQCSGTVPVLALTFVQSSLLQPDARRRETIRFSDRAFLNKAKRRLHSLA
jgi:hypothetical protein